MRIRQKPIKPKSGTYKNCLVCGKEFYAYKYSVDLGLARFCSRKCGVIGRKRVVPWNKGTKGVMKPNKTSFKKGVIPKNSVIFKKGHTSWNTGLKLPQFSGENHPSWKGGKLLHQRKYYLIFRPDHPKADKKGYVREHRLVMEEHLGRYLYDSELIHHKNDNKLDNRIENLQVVTRPEHIKIHRVELDKARWNR